MVQIVVTSGLMCLFLACSSGGGDSQFGTISTGTISVLLMDAPVGDVTGVYVKIAGLFIQPQGDGPVIELAMAELTVTVNLLEHTADNAAVLIDDATIPSGSYNWLEMEVNAEHDGIMDSYVITKAGGQEDLLVPSKRIRLVNGFDVAPNQAVRFLFDWDTRKGLVNPPPGGFLATF